MWRLSFCLLARFFVFFFNDTATTEIYTLSLHDALPISDRRLEAEPQVRRLPVHPLGLTATARRGREVLAALRSEEHTSELQSQSNLVCRLLLEKKKQHTPVTSRRPPTGRSIRGPRTPPY